MKTGRADILKGLIIAKKRLLHMTEDEFARAMGKSGVTVSRWLREKHTDEWKLGDILDACRVLEISDEDILKAIKF